MLETVGTQEYEVKPADFADRLAESYGDECAAEVLPHLASAPSRLAPLQGLRRRVACTGPAQRRTG